MSVSCFDREDETFIVLINQEEQYSIWPEWKAVPAGWQAVAGVQGDKATCKATLTSTGQICDLPLCVSGWLSKRNKVTREYIKH